MANVGYVNEEVRKMYGIPLSQLTPEQRRILKADGERRKKLIEERQKAVQRDNKKAFEDTEKFNKVLASCYSQAQKSILGDVAAAYAQVKKDGGTWSYANASKITRGRGLFEQINKELAKLGQTENTYFKNHFTNIYTDQFLRATYTLGQTVPVKGSFNLLNTRLVEQTLNYPWSGAMFSDRLWTDKERLGRNLRIGLTQSMILGEDMDQIADRIGANLNTSKYNAMRIARTETKRVTYVSQAEAWKAQGIKQVRYMAANNGGDSRTCDYCRSLHGKVYTLGEEPTLPRHPNCRCWYVPVTPDTFGDNELNELTGSIRGSENYEKWKQEYQEALNADGTYKPGWGRDWKDGGKVKYTASDGKKYTLDEYRKMKAQEEIPKDVKTLITEDVEAKKKECQAYRDKLQMDIDAKYEEHKNIPSEYTAQIQELETKKAGYQSERDLKVSEHEKLSIQKSGISGRRSELFDKLDKGEITEDEYDTLSGALRAERRTLSDKISDAEGEIYFLDEKIKNIDDKLAKVQKEIKDRQSTVLSECIKLEDEMRESLGVEKDFDLDILYVGDSKERYENIEAFRKLRTGRKALSPADWDDYKGELVEAAKKLDKEGLETSAKLVEMRKEVLKAGAVTDKQLQDAGALMRKQIQKHPDFPKVADKEAIVAAKRLELDTCADELKRLEKKYRESGYSAEAYKAYREYHQNTYLKTYNEWRQSLEEAKTLAQSISEDATTSFLKTLREIGVDDSVITGHLGMKSLKVKSAQKLSVIQAYKHYPSDWVKFSTRKSGLTVKKVKRGYYSGWRSEIAISGDTVADCIGTAYHELGHRFEDSVPGILKAETEFYNRRTAGETLKWMGNGYRRDEKTRKDNFIDAYMGKDYGGTFYELVSMGFQYAYTDVNRLCSDTDYANFIYGILSLV